MQNASNAKRGDGKNDQTVAKISDIKKENQTIRRRISQGIQSFAKQRPAAFICLIFTGIVAFFWFLLSLPFASTGELTPSPLVAFFTTASALSGTGFTIVPTGIYWSWFGKIVIVVAMQLGGLGIMTLASMLGLLVSHHLGLTTRILTASDIRGSKFGEIGSLIRIILTTTFSIEAVLFFIMLPKFREISDTFIEAVGHSVFFSVSAFNNVGMISSANELREFSTHFSILIPMIVGITLGSLGFPVLRSLSQCIKKRSFKFLSLHAKLVLIVYFAMDILLLVWFFSFESDNSALFQNYVYQSKTVHSVDLSFTALTARSSGFGLIDANYLSHSTLFLIEIWMFIGGGPASTVAGIKVTTFAVVILAIIAEFRGTKDIFAFGKRLPESALRVAITVIMCSAIIIFIFATLFSLLSPASFQVIFFDTISAFANCGMTLGLASTMHPVGQVALAFLMIIGRLGPMTIATALMKRIRTDAVNYPEEGVSIG